MMVGTEGLLVVSSAQADRIRSQRPSVSPSSVASRGRSGRSPDLILLMTAGSRRYEWNGMRPVNTCE